MNLVFCAAVPTSSIYGTARRGPTSHLLGWASPIRTRAKGPVRRWANWWRSILTFSPLISPYTFKLFNLNLTLYYLFTCFALGPRLIADRYVGHASSWQLSLTIRLTATMHISVLKQDLNLSLGPLVIEKSKASRKTHVDLGGRPLVSGSASTCLILWCSMLLYDSGFSPLQHITHRQSVWQYTWHVAIGVKNIRMVYCCCLPLSIPSKDFLNHFACPVVSYYAKLWVHNPTLGTQPLNHNYFALELFHNKTPSANVSYYCGFH